MRMGGWLAGVLIGAMVMCDGLYYPFRVIQSWRIKVEFVTTVVEVPKVMDIPTVVVHCGPCGCQPEVPSPDDILTSALGLFDLT